MNVLAHQWSAFWEPLYSLLNLIFHSDEATHIKKETAIMYFFITGAIIKCKCTNYKFKTVQYLNLPKASIIWKWINWKLYHKTNLQCQTNFLETFNVLPALLNLNLFFKWYQFPIYTMWSVLFDCCYFEEHISWRLLEG